MYFDFEGYRPDFSPVGRAISWREGVLLSIIVHLAMVILLLLAPHYLPRFARQVPQDVVARPPQEDTQFVFVQPRREMAVLKPPNRGEASDRDRVARATERAPNPTNPLPYSRGNTPERVDNPPPQASAARGPASVPEPQAGNDRASEQDNFPSNPPDLRSSLPTSAPAPQVARNSGSGRGTGGGGLLEGALKSLRQAYSNGQFDNPNGSSGQFGPEIQFDTKGVEFGPWIRRFVAQVKRNWVIPEAARFNHGHVVMTFNVHKDGSITDLVVLGPSAIVPFNNAAFGALSGSNPTQPLPPEYPSDKAFFTVTFYYNETAPR